MEKDIEFIYKNQENCEDLTNKMHEIVLKIRKRRDKINLKEMEKRSYFPPVYIGPKIESCFMNEWR